MVVASEGWRRFLDYYLAFACKMSVISQARRQSTRHVRCREESRSIMINKQRLPSTLCYHGIHDRHCQIQSCPVLLILSPSIQGVQGVTTTTTYQTFYYFAVTLPYTPSRDKAAQFKSVILKTSVC